MMMRVFVNFADILIWFVVEGLLAAQGTEIIGLALVFGLTGRGCGVNIHVTDGIVHCCCHRFYLLLLNGLSH